jgi:hypothetical protein
MRDAFGCFAACLLAALVPFAPQEGAGRQEQSFPGWPERWEGRALSPRAATAAEAEFARRFPGRIGAFDDGQRHLLLRYVTQPTRRLHPASDCYRGAGYATEPRPVRIDESGSRWGCFRAHRAGKDLLVCESIRDMHGRIWSDVSSWYWATALARSPGPWWAVTVAEAQPTEPGAGPTVEPRPASKP